MTPCSRRWAERRVVARAGRRVVARAGRRVVARAGRPEHAVWTTLPTAGLTGPPSAHVSLRIHPASIAGSTRAAMTAAVVASGLAPDLRRYRRILLATDLAASSEPATAEAFRLATQLGAAVLIVNVIDAGAFRRVPGHTPALHEVRLSRERAVVELVGRGREHGLHVSFLIWEGDPAAAIVEAATAEGADLIVIGNRGHRGVGRALIGSVSDEVVRTAGCPVLVVRRSAPD
jgi:nucleotide-binding universal stress UspA family protein